MMNLFKTRFGAPLRYALLVLLALGLNTSIAATISNMQHRANAVLEQESNGGVIYQVNGEEVSEAVFKALDKAAIERVEVMRNADGTRTMNALTKPEPKAMATLSAPIYMLNGKEISKAEADKIEAANIASVHVYKGEQAIEKFGKKGKDGVIEIVLK